MKSLFLFALLFFAVACGGNADRRSSKPGGRTPELGVIETVYEVLNEKDRTRAGFVNKVSYDSGRIIYWVYGTNYREKMGYVLTNNRAFKYVWQAGSNKPVEKELIADTMNANVRRVLHFWREGDQRASRIDPRYSPAQLPTK